MTHSLELTVGGTPRTCHAGEQLIVGAAHDCDVVVASHGPNGPAAHHVRLRHERGAWWLFDLGAGHTAVDATPVRTSVRLRGTGSIALGAGAAQVTIAYSTAAGARAMSRASFSWPSLSRQRLVAAGVAGLVLCGAVGAVGAVMVRGGADDSTGSDASRSAVTTTVGRHPTTTIAPTASAPPDSRPIGGVGPAGNPDCAADTAAARSAAGEPIGFESPTLTYVDGDGVPIPALATPESDLWSTNFTTVAPFGTPLHIDAADADAALTALVRAVDEEWTLRFTSGNYRPVSRVLFVLVGEPGSYAILPMDGLTLRTSNGIDLDDQAGGVAEWRQRVLAGCVLSWLQVVGWATRDTVDIGAVGQMCVRTLIGADIDGAVEYVADYRLVAAGDHAVAGMPTCEPAATPVVNVPTGG